MNFKRYTEYVHKWTRSTALSTACSCETTGEEPGTARSGGHVCNHVMTSPATPSRTFPLFLSCNIAVGPATYIGYWATRVELMGCKVIGFPAPIAAAMISVGRKWLPDWSAGFGKPGEESKGVPTQVFVVTNCVTPGVDWFVGAKGGRTYRLSINTYCVTNH